MGPIPPVTDRPMRLAVADPPYPGRAELYIGHPDYRGEVDHHRLLADLAGYDGWALATSADALPALCVMAHDLGLVHRVASWHRGHRVTRAGYPLSAWEPVLYRPARPGIVGEQVPDALQHGARARTTDPLHVVGAKPAAWCAWVFGLLQARVGDQISDLFPGSGGVGRAWRVCEAG